MHEGLKDAAGHRGRGLVFDDHLVNGLNVGGVVGEDGDVGGKFCDDLVWGTVFLVNFDDEGNGSGHASVARKKEWIETFHYFLGFYASGALEAGFSNGTWQ